MEGDVDVQGGVVDGFEPVRDAFAENFRRRGDVGAALTVHHEGRVVVDLWAGRRHADRRPAGAEPWDAETAVVIRSATKGPAAAVLHLLHQRGQLDLDAPVATYWPEFKAAGKERVLVRHLLAHRAGLPALDTPLTPEQAVDGVSGPRAVAAQAPMWEPGTAHGYHAHTYGWLLGELVRRATGRTFARWFAEEVARPYGLHLWIGAPETAGGPPGLAAPGVSVGRIADVSAPPPPEADPGGPRVRPKRSVMEAWRDPDSPTRRAFGAVDPPPDENDADYRAAGSPASGGVATARSLSRFYAALIGPVPERERADGRGPFTTRRLFTPATLTQARSQESAGPDRVLVVGTRFGLGFMLHGPSAPMLSPGSFGHPGRGGSLGFADPEWGVGFGYVTGGMQKTVTSDPRARALVRALRGCLEARRG